MVTEGLSHSPFCFYFVSCTSLTPSTMASGRLPLTCRTPAQTSVSMVKGCFPSSKGHTSCAEDALTEQQNWTLFCTNTSPVASSARRMTYFLVLIRLRTTRDQKGGAEPNTIWSRTIRRKHLKIAKAGIVWTVPVSFLSLAPPLHYTHRTGDTQAPGGKSVLSLHAALGGQLLWNFGTRPKKSEIILQMSVPNVNPDMWLITSSTLLPVCLQL